MSDSDLRKAAQDISAYFAGNPYGLVSAHLMERLRAALAQPQEDHSPDAGKMVSSQQGQAAPTVETGLVVMRDKVSRRWYVYSPEHKGVCTLFRVVSGPFGDQPAANAALAGLMKAAQPQAEPVECARCGHMNWIMPGKNAS